MEEQPHFVQELEEPHLYHHKQKTKSLIKGSLAMATRYENKCYIKIDIKVVGKTM